MRVETSTETDATKHIVIGELDADNCGELGELVASGGPDEATIDLDLGQVTFLDSSALSELLRIKTAVEESGSQFSVSNASPQVRRVFEITGLVATFGLP